MSRRSTDDPGVGVPPARGTKLPRRWGGYVLYRLLGEGGMGVVFLAGEFPGHGKAYDEGRADFAVKVPKLAELEELARHGRAPDHWLDEARRLPPSHDNLVRVRGFGVEQGVPFIAFDYVRGVSLASLSKAVEPAVAVRVALDVAVGMAELHRVGVIHRDIKPSNVMVAHGGVAKVLDLGLARDVTAGHQSSRVAGTPEFMAPERWRGSSQPSVDTFAVGLLLHRLLTGESILRALTHDEMASRAMNIDALLVAGGVEGRVRPLGGEGLAELVVALLRQEPSRRRAWLGPGGRVLHDGPTTSWVRRAVVTVSRALPGWRVVSLTEASGVVTALQHVADSAGATHPRIRERLDGIARGVVEGEVIPPSRRTVTFRQRLWDGRSDRRGDRPWVLWRLADASARWAHGVLRVRWASAGAAGAFAVVGGAGGVLAAMVGTSLGPDVGQIVLGEDWSSLRGCERPLHVSDSLFWVPTPLVTTPVAWWVRRRRGFRLRDLLIPWCVTFVSAGVASAALPICDRALEFTVLVWLCSLYALAARVWPRLRGWAWRPLAAWATTSALLVSLGEPGALLWVACVGFVGTADVVSRDSSRAAVWGVRVRAFSAVVLLLAVLVAPMALAGLDLPPRESEPGVMAFVAFAVAVLTMRRGVAVVQSLVDSPLPRGVAGWGGAVAAGGLSASSLALSCVAWLVWPPVTDADRLRAVGTLGVTSGLAFAVSLILWTLAARRTGRGVALVAGLVGGLPALQVAAFLLPVVLLREGMTGLGVVGWAWVLTQLGILLLVWGATPTAPHDFDWSRGRPREPSPWLDPDFSWKRWM